MSKEQPTTSAEELGREMHDEERAKRLAQRFMQLPPVQWREAMDKLSERDGSLLEGELCALAQSYARAAGYVAHRFPGPQRTEEPHQIAVKAANRAVADLRRALGFTLPNAPVTF